MAQLTAVLKALGTTRNAVNYWRAAGYLKTRFKRTTSGLARDLTRENALEIGFMSALTFAGVAPAAAVPVVQSWLDTLREGELDPIHVVVRGPDGRTVGFSVEGARKMFPQFSHLGSMEASSEQEKALAEIVPTYINIDQLLQRISSLYDKAGS